MRTLSRFVLALALVTGMALGQSGELSVLHGLPGLPNAVDVLIDGTPAFTGVNFGDDASTALAAGSYTVDFADATGVLLSGTATVVDGERTTVAAHLSLGGAATLSTFTDNNDAVSGFGNVRVRVRHLADADILISFSNTGPGTAINFIEAQGEFDFETVAGTYDFEFAELDLSNPTGQFSFVFGSGSLGGIAAGPFALAADEELTINVVGTANTASFGVILQTQSLDVATPQPVLMPDLAISGSLIGSTIDVGGDLNYAVTGGAPNEVVAILLSTDNTPQPILPGVTLGIGGATGVFPIGFGLADGAGDLSGTFSFPGFPVSLTGATQTIYTQAVSVDYLGFGNSQVALSDIESFSIGL